MRLSKHFPHRFSVIRLIGLIGFIGLISACSPAQLAPSPTASPFGLTESWHYLSLGGVVAALVLWLAAWIYALRKTVARRTQELKASEQRLQTIFDSVNDAIFIHDLQTGAILDVNRKMAEMYGCTPDAARRLSVGALSAGEPPYTEADALAWMTKAAAGTPQVFEWHARRQDGQLFWVEVNMRRASVGGQDQLLVTVRDVTERRRIEQALAQSQANLSALIESTDDLVWAVDLNYNLLVGNTALDRHFQHNYGTHAQAGVPSQNFLPRDRAVQWPPLYRRALAEGPYRMEYALPDGRILELALRPMEKDQEQIGVSVFGKDITERKQAEQALRASELKFRSFFEGSRDGFVVVDGQGVILDANRAYCELVGYALEELRQMDFWALTPKKWHAWERREIIESHLPQQGYTGLYEKEYIHKDGHTFPIELSAFTVGDDLTGAQYLWAVVRDITGRKRAEEELRQYQEHLEELVKERTASLEQEIAERKRAERLLTEAKDNLELVFNTNPDSVMTICLADGLVVNVNEGFTALTGFTRAEAIGKTTLDIGLWANPDDRHQILQQLDRQGFCENYEALFKRKDGSQLVGIVSVRRFAFQDVPHLIAVTRDITDRKQMETELQRAKDAAEAANRAKSLFLANMSHELRTPLNAILGFAQLMAREPALSKTARNHLAIINRSGEHLLDMINEVLDLAKIEAGRTEVQPEVFDLPQTLRDLTEMIRSRAEAKGLTVLLELMPEAPRYVRADRGKLRQILINLLGNAVKFTSHGGVALRARLITPARIESGPQLDLEVEDSGLGIPASQLGTIFEPFVQGGGKTGEQPGTGLGLTISRNFARMLGGDLTVESVVGQGSVFRLTVPLELATPDEVPAPVHAAPEVVGLEPGQPEWHILVVEDNAESRLLLETQLAQAGFAVRVAINGQEAVAVAQAWPPHLIWMDIRMPVMDGFEATRQIRRLPVGQQVRIVALTASVFKDQEAHIRAAGCDEVLHKPYHLSQVFETMARLLGVRYCYAAPEVPPPTSAAVAQPVSGDLTGLSPETAYRLRQAARELKKKKVLMLAAELETAHPALANYLRQEMAAYRFETVLALLDRLGEEPQP